MNKKNQSSALTQRYKSFTHLMLIVTTFALGAFYFGYTIAYFSSIDFHTLIDVYSIHWEQSTAQGLLTSCVPIGGGIGALSSNLLMRVVSRRNYVFVVNAIALVAGGLLYIPNPYILLMVRIVQGVCVGLFSAITPLIINQISPNQVSGSLGAINQFFVAFGVFFAFLFKYILQAITNDQTGNSIWYIVFGFQLITIVFQSILLKFVFPYQTPKYLLQNNRQQQARKLIEVIYKEQFVEEVLQQKYIDIGKSSDNNGTNKQSSASIMTYNKQQTESFLVGKRKDSKIAVIMALHVALLQQFVGINSVVAYGGDIAQKAIPSLKSIFPILINLQQVLTVIIVSYLLSRVGRKTILQAGTAVGAIANGVIGVGFFIKDSNQDIANVMILLGLVVFMANFGVSLGPVVWLYIPQIVQPSIIPFSTAINWAGATCCMLLFPIIKQILPNKNQGYLFMFFSVWCIISFLVNAKFLIQTKGKTEKQVAEQYHKLL